MIRDVFVEHPQRLEFIQYFILIVIILLNPALTNNYGSYEEQYSKTSPCLASFNKTDKYFLESNEECDVYKINIDLEKETSIINLTASIKYLGNQTEEPTEANFIISVSEYTKHFDDDNKEEEILFEKWTVHASAEYNYLSRSSKVSIAVPDARNWAQYNISFSFEEIEYRLIRLSPPDQDVNYEPNCVSLFRLDTTGKGVMIEFENLTIITEMGEYLLIGAGTEPFEDSRSMYITQVTNTSKFYVEDSKAYVAFVSGSIQKDNKSFRIKWHYEKYDVQTTEDPLGVMNSSLICFYNYSAAEEQRKEDDFKAFREKFATHISDSLENTLSFVLPQEVELFGKPTPKELDGKEEALSLLVKIVRNGKSIFTWRQLQGFMKEFEKKDEKSTYGYTIGRCPQDREPLYKKDEWSIIMYSMVPVFAIFALIIWAWKQKIFSQKCKPEKEETLSFDAPVHAEPNTYVMTTIPKVLRSDEQGRRETLIQGNFQEDSVTCETAMVEMEAIPSTSAEPDTLTRFLTSRKKSRPSLHSLLGKTDESKEESQDDKNGGNESEHLYDSVGSSKQLSETKL